jgi:hypothetical protein
VCVAVTTAALNDSYGSRLDFIRTQNTIRAVDGEPLVCSRDEGRRDLAESTRVAIAHIVQHLLAWTDPAG